MTLQINHSLLLFPDILSSVRVFIQMQKGKNHTGKKTIWGKMGMEIKISGQDNIG